MLFKRLKHSVPEIGQMEYADGSVPWGLFLRELFDDPRNFETLVVASHGIPRAFWLLFHKCASRFKMDFSNYAIHSSAIREAARDLFLQEKRKRLEKASAAHILYTRISSTMQATKSRIFMVPAKEAKTSIALRKLVDEELVHPIPSAMVPRVLRDDYKMFSVDYGNYVDWQYSLKEPWKDLEEEMLPRIPQSPESQGISCVVTASDVEDAAMCCESCKRSFNPKHPVYLQYGTCPQCAQPAKTSRCVICPACHSTFDREAPIFVKLGACPLCAETVKIDD